MKSPGDGRITVSGLREKTIDELDALADAEDKTRSAKVRELIEDEVGDAVSNDTGQYLPADDTLREVYTATVDAANRNLTVRFDRHGGDIAQQVGIGKKAVRGHLFRLQRRGYVKHLSGGAAGGGHNMESYRVKPKCANPKMWRYAPDDVYDPEAVRALEATEPEDAGDRLDDPDAAEPEVSQSAD